MRACYYAIGAGKQAEMASEPAKPTDRPTDRQIDPVKTATNTSRQERHRTKERIEPTKCAAAAAITNSAISPAIAIVTIIMTRNTATQCWFHLILRNDHRIRIFHCSPDGWLVAVVTQPLSRCLA